MNYNEQSITEQKDMSDKQKKLFAIKVGNNKKWSIYLVDLLVVVNVFFNIFLPTSQNKVIYGVDRLIFVWAVLLLEVFLLMIHNKVHKLRLAGSVIGINVYMIIVTILAKDLYPDARVSLARIVPIISLLILCSIEIENYPNIDFMKAILSFISIVAIVWNALIILRIPQIIDFTYNNYNQYYDMCGYYQLVFGHKPVMSFGVHTYASFFYFLLFILCYATYRTQSKTIYLFYCYMYSLFCLFCVSTSSIIFFMIMVGVLVSDTRRFIDKKAFALIFLLITAGFIIVYFNFNDLYSRIYQNVTSGSHSFSARYSSSSIFDLNIDIIKRSLGIGYNIISSLDISYGDSGYIVYLTMGNIPFMVALYYCILKFLNANIKMYKSLVLIAVFGFEIGIPGTFNYRFSYFIIFVVMYLGALKNVDNDKRETDVNTSSNTY